MERSKNSPWTIYYKSPWLVASPIRLPDWIPSNPHTLWSIPNFRPDRWARLSLRLWTHPKSGVRPEIHLAHNPLDTLEEEDIFPNQQYSHPKYSCPRNALNQSVGNANYGSKILLDNFSSQESSGRGKFKFRQRKALECSQRPTHPVLLGILSKTLPNKQC